MALWSADHFDFDDAINADLWARLRAPVSSRKAGVLQYEHGLRPVPDLVGKRWREPGSVFIVGSAYAPFFTEGAGRAHTMPLSDYREARTAAQFQRSFVANVVTGDRSYYEPLGGLIDRTIGDRKRVALLDLVRGSFVHFPDRSGGDGAVKADPAHFMSHAQAGWTWTSSRMQASRAEVIVALGGIAEHGLIKLLVANGARVEVYGHPGARLAKSTLEVDKPASSLSLGSFTGGGMWWDVTWHGRRWRVLPVYHPARANQHDARYTRTVAALKAALGLLPTADAEGGRVPGTSPAERWVEGPPEEPIRRTRRGGWKNVRGSRGGEMSQRDMMRQLWAAHRGDQGRVVREYAKAEAAGLVHRHSNMRGESAYEYAERLLYDGLAKGWL